MNRVMRCVSLVLLASGLLSAQTYKVLYTFEGAQMGDGSSPQGKLIFGPSGNLYGTTYGGGNAPACPSGCGTIFELSPNTDASWSETILYSFCTYVVNNRCADGYGPEAGLAMDTNGNLYGTTSDGGLSNCPNSFGCGTVFELSPPAKSGGSWELSVLYSLCQDYSNNTCMDGTTPASQVAVDPSGNVYGTTTFGGTADRGVVFELSGGPSGWFETVLHSFCAAGNGNICPDGSFPYAGVTIDSLGNLYGTTKEGGSSGQVGGGTIYKLSPGSEGWTEEVLFASHQPFPYGSSPIANVSIDGHGNFYTTGSAGGLVNAGSVVKASPSGGTSRSFVFNGFNGSFPAAGVLLHGGALYGTTARAENSQGNQVGNVFKIEMSGNETVLYTFCQMTNCSDGDQPVAALVADQSGNLYGTAEAGGIGGFGGYGVVFEVIP